MAFGAYSITRPSNGQIKYPLHAKKLKFSKLSCCLRNITYAKLKKTDVNNKKVAAKVTDKFSPTYKWGATSEMMPRPL